MAPQHPKPVPPREAWLEQVYADKETTPMRFMVAFGVRIFANSKTLECFPSQARLASSARVTRRTVQIELAALRDRGHIETICPANRRLGNRYRLLIKGDQPALGPTPDGPAERAEIANAGSPEKSGFMQTGIRMGKPASCEQEFAWPCESGFASIIFRASRAAAFRARSSFGSQPPAAHHAAPLAPMLLLADRYARLRRAAWRSHRPEGQNVHFHPPFP